jgi:hypothetical protein
MREQTRESKCALAVGRSQRKIRGARAHFQSLSAVFHAELTLGDGEIGNNNGWGTGGCS